MADSPNRRIACLFGLNYSNDPQSRLRGCINDVVNMGDHLRTEMGFKVEVHTDEGPVTWATSAAGIRAKLRALAALTVADSGVEVVWLHFSSHGTNVRDFDGDEADGRDEALVPSDYATAGVILDDELRDILATFRTGVRVVAVFDCCHSGSICDLRYTWKAKRAVTDSKKAMGAHVCVISGCMDSQTSMDAWNEARAQFCGALTSCFLDNLKARGTTGTVFDLMAATRRTLMERGFSQVPVLSSSYDLTREPRFFD